MEKESEPALSSSPQQEWEVCGHVSYVGAGEWAGLRTEETWWVQALAPFGGAGGLPDQAGGWLSRPARSPSLCPPPEPDNEAHMRSTSRPCSPVHHHEGHTKLASSPHRASPVRMGPAYVLKKGSEERAGRKGRRGARAGAGGPGPEAAPLAAVLGLQALSVGLCRASFTWCL